MCVEKEMYQVIVKVNGSEMKWIASSESIERKLNVKSLMRAEKLGKR